MAVQSLVCDAGSTGHTRRSPCVWADSRAARVCVHVRERVPTRAHHPRACSNSGKDGIGVGKSVDTLMSFLKADSTMLSKPLGEEDALAKWVRPWWAAWPSARGTHEAAWGSPACGPPRIHARRVGLEPAALKQAATPQGGPSAALPRQGPPQCRCPVLRALCRLQAVCHPRTTLPPPPCTALQAIPGPQARPQERLPAGWDRRQPRRRRGCACTRVFAHVPLCGPVCGAVGPWVWEGALAGGAQLPP